MWNQNQKQSKILKNYLSNTSGSKQFINKYKVRHAVKTLIMN